MIDDFFHNFIGESYSNETEFEELPVDNITDDLEENTELLHLQYEDISALDIEDVTFAEEIGEDFIALVDSFVDLGGVLGEAIIDPHEHEESPFEVPVTGYLDSDEGNSLDMDIREALEDDERVIVPLDSSTILESGVGNLDYNSALDASSGHIFGADKSPGSQNLFEDISAKSTQGPSNPFSQEPSQVKGGIFAADESDSPGVKHITNYMDDPSNPYSNTLSLEPIPESKMRLTELRNQTEMNFYNNLTHQYERERQDNVEYYKHAAEMDIIRGDDPRANVERLKIYSK